MDDKPLRDVMFVAFDYSYLHDDWVTPLTDALTGTTAADAGWTPGAGLKCIWEIVLHMAVWTENIVERIRTGERARPAEGAWPALPPVLSEVAWSSAQQRLWNALAELRAFMESSSLETLSAGPYGLGDLFCRFIHNAYHIGQITKMRELLEVRAAQAATVSTVPATQASNL